MKRIWAVVVICLSGLVVLLLGGLAPAHATQADIVIRRDAAGSLHIIAARSLEADVPLSFHLDSTPQEIIVSIVEDLPGVDTPRRSFACQNLPCRISTDQVRLPISYLGERLHLNLMGDVPKTVTLGPLSTAALTVSGIGANDRLIVDGPLTVATDVRIEGHGEVVVQGPVEAPLGFVTESAILRLNSLIKVVEGAIVLSAKKDLTLMGSQLYSGADLSLYAGKTIQIRDNEQHPFSAQAGADLLLQGDQQIDIFALSHPASGLFSGGDLRLRSANPVKGDIHYYSGRQFKIEQLDGQAGHLISPYDPIILAEGDVALGDYTGASLHILAGGSVLLNSATITGTDTTANTINPGNGTTFNGATTLGTLATFNLSNNTALTIDGSTNPTLDIRAGIDWNALAGAPAPPNQVTPPGAVTPAFGGATSAAITIANGLTVTQPEGVVLLTNQYQPNGLAGNISVGDIDVSTAISATNAGSITIDSRGDIATGALSAQAEVAGTGVTAGNGGSITLLAPNGNIDAGGNLATFSRVPVNSSGSVGDGGPILLSAAGDIAIDGGNGAVESFAFANSEGNAGNGGNVTLETSGGNIALGRILSQSFAGSNGSAGDGGNVTVTANGGNVNIDGGFFAFSSVQTFAQDFSNSAGDAGSVVISATNGITVAQGIDARTPGNNSQAGDISLISTSGNINTGFLRAFAANTNTPGAPGDVTVRAPDGSIVTGDVEAYSNALVINNPARNSGDITIEALNGDVVSGRLLAYSEARGQLGDTGNGGIIQVTAGGSIISTGEMLAYARSAINNGDSGTAGTGGSITLQATQNISITGSLESFSEAQIFNGEGGAAASGGPITVTAANGRIAIAGDVSAYASAKDNVSDGGDITLVAVNGIDLDNGASSLKANTTSLDGSVGSGGNVRVETANGDLSLNSVNAGATNTFGAGPAGEGGNINLATGNGYIQVTGNFFAAIQSVASTADTGGPAGDVTLSATQGITVSAPIRAQGLGTTVDGGEVTLTTTAGNITTAEVLALSINNNNLVGNGGNVTLKALDGGITTGDVGTYARALLIHNTTGDGGNINLNASNGDVVTGKLEAYSEARGEFGDTGNGGRVEVTATNGSILVNGDIRADAFSQDNNLRSGDAGNSQGIRLQATQDIAVSGGLKSYARSSRFDGLPTPTGSAGNAGPVTLTANNISLSYVDARSIATGTIGSGGVVNITAGQFFRGSGVIFGTDETISTVGLANSSAITITHGGSGVVPFIVGDPTTNGVTGTLTTGDTTLSPPQSFLFDHFEAPNLWILSVAAPVIVINEIMKAPAAALDENGEWLELHNPGDGPVDLNGCRLKDDGSDDHLIDNGGPLIIDPGGYLTLGKNSDTVLNGGLDVDYAYGQFGFFLNDVADEVVLQCGGVEIDRVDYDNSLAFPNATGASMQLLAPTLDNNAGANWCEAAVVWPGSAGDRGTPGATNNCPTDLTLSLTVSQGVVTPGQPLAFIIGYANNGPSTADAVITDIIPSELINASFTSSGATIIPVGGVTYAWQVPNLLPGSGGTITITGVVSPGLANGLVFTNTAEIVAASDSDAKVVKLIVGAPPPPIAAVYLPLLLKIPPAAPPDLIVDELVAASNAITLVVKNIGGSHVVDAFWIDVYINPDTPPTGVNQEWYELGDQGIAWGVVAPALPIGPDETLTLTIGDAYYRPDLSNFLPPLAVGTPVYAQVDSVNLLTDYGGVLESHEITGGVYNNITQTVSISGATVTIAVAEETPLSEGSLPAR